MQHQVTSQDFSRINIPASDNEKIIRHAPNIVTFHFDE